MATKYLRKIILEELQKVLSEQVYDTDIFGGQGPIDPSQAPLGSPLNPRESAPYLDPQYVRSKPRPKVKSKAQLRREAVRRMQKELERLGYPGDLQKPGVFDDVTLEHLQMTFPGIDKTRTPDSISTDTINTFVSFLKKKPTGYANVALANKKEIPLPSGKTLTDIELQARRGISAGQPGMSVVPPAPPVATDNLSTTRKEEEPKPVGPTAEEKAALTKKAREEREAETKVRRSLKAQGFEESITREIRKLLRSI